MVFITVDRTLETSLTQQIYDQIRKGILAKEWKEGERIFSSRDLATQIGVSRNIVLEAYDRLISEGYLEVRPQTGTFVAEGTSIFYKEKHEYTEQWSYKDNIDRQYIDFKGGNPAIEYFPRKKWAQLTRDVCLHASDSIFGYAESYGMEELRDVLVKYLQRVRGVSCQPEQIIITSGATQALKLITDVLLTDGETVAIEDPVTDEMRNIFTSANASLVPVAVDEDGINPDYLPKDKPGCIFVIPSHQYPLGGILSIQRRLQLIEYVQRMDSYIVEDDYDSEFTYEGAPVPAIQGIAPNHVIYVGTFSKILSPALRIGYLILPKHLVDRFKKAKWYSDRHTSSIEQLVLAQFIEDGHLDKHVRKMRKIYKDKRELLVRSVQKYFKKARIIGKSAGMHLVVELPGILINRELAKKIEKKGVKIYPIEEYSLTKGVHSNRFVMGYGGLTPEEITKGVALLKDTLIEEGLIK